MSYTATFDTLEFAKTLQAEGFQTKQAEGLSKALRQAFQSAENGRQEELKAVETKLQEELKSSRNELQAELKAAKGELATKGDVLSIKDDIQTIKVDIASLRVEIHAAKVELLKWMLGAIVTTGGLCTAIASLFATYFR